MRTPFAAAVLAAVIVLLPAAALAEVPATLSHNGFLTDLQGSAVTGAAAFSFGLYGSADGSDVIWSEEHPAVTVTDGFYAVTLGLTTSLKDVFGTRKDVWLEVSVDGKKMTPRQKISAVPYAVVAGDAVGDIHPASISVNGSPVVDKDGKWVGDTSAFGDVTAVSVTAPLTGGGASGDVTVGLAKADGATDGYLAGTDWVAFASKQSRVAGTCSTGNAVSEVNADGTVVCVPVGTATGDISNVAVTAPLTGGGATGDVIVGIAQCTSTTDGYLSAADWVTFNGKQGAVTGTCAAGSAIRAISADGTVTCDADPAYTAAAGSGLDLTGTAFSLLKTCAVGNVLKWDGAAWICAADANAGGTVTGVTASAPLASSGGAAPNLTIAKASGAADGYLSSVDWTVFNGKEGAIAAGAGTQYWRGDKTWQTLNTTAVAEGTGLYYTDARARSALSGTAPISYNAATGAISVSANTAAAAGVVATGAGQANMVWKTDGTGNPAWRADATGAGTVTSIAAGTGLAATPASPITSVGALSLAAAYQDGSAYDARFVRQGQAGSVTGPMIQAGAVAFSSWSDNACAAGNVPKWSGAQWICAADNNSGTITGVTAGTGLAGGGGAGTVTLNADTTYLQRRVSASCPGGEAVQGVNADGTVACAFITGGGGGTVTQINTGAGLTGGPITGTGTVSVEDDSVTTAMIKNGTLLFEDWASGGCAAGEIPKFNGTIWACAADADTVYAAGTGLVLDTGTFSLLKTCADADVLQWNNTSGAWECKAIASSGGTVTQVNTTGPITGGGFTVTGTIGITQATGTTDGYLSSADWTAFAGKEPGVPAGTALQYLRGDKSWQTLDTAAVLEGTGLYFTDARARGALSGTAPITFDGPSGAIGAVQATGSVDGYLSAADWTAFSGKQARVTGSCAAGSAVSAINADGTVTCEVDAVYAAGTGLALSAGTFSLLKTCADADVLQWNNTSGAWECKPIVSSGGTVTQVNATGPITGGGFTVTGTIGITQATGATDGYLSAADWTAFAGKEPGVTAGTTAQYLRGDKSWQTLDTTAVPEGTGLYFTNARARGALSGTAPITFDGPSGAIGAVQATGSVDGYLSAADWSAFSGKQARVTGSCAAGTSINGVNADGTVTCEGNAGNADTVDTLHAASFLRSDAASALTTGTLTLQAGTTLDTSLATILIGDTVTKTGATMVANLNADLLDGQHGNYYSPTTHDHDTAYWRVAGNAGTSGAYLGTSDNQDLEIKVNNNRAFLIGASTTPNIIGGSSSNAVTVGVNGAAIAGGGAGGSENRVTDDYGAIGGGSSNVAGDGAGTTGDRSHATVGGGQSNAAAGQYSTIGGGSSNAADGQYAVVTGGQDGSAAGMWSAVLGGRSSSAEGDYSFSAGRRAKATNQGAFVWADSVDADYSSSGQDQFRARASGGVRFDVNNSRWATVFDDGTDLIATSTGAHLTLGGAWTDNSDRGTKEDFRPVDGREVLDRLASMPVTSWRYKVERDVRHIGPVAQDFHDAFQVGNDERHLAALDTGGVALAAIKGLDEIRRGQESRVRDLERQVQALAARNEDLSARLERLEKGRTAGARGDATPFWLLTAGLVFGAALLGGRRLASKD